MASGGRRFPWTPEEDEILIANHTLSETELRDLFPTRSGTAVSHRKGILQRAGRIPASAPYVPPKDWNKLWPTVQRMRREGATFKQVAAAIGCSTEAVSRQERKRGMLRGEPVTSLIRRSCLTCQKTFMADGRFNRLCSDCKHSVSACAFA